MSPQDQLADAAITRAASAGGPVSVHGVGSLAAALREHFDEQPERPSTVIETSGTADGLSAALEAVDDLGTVIVAATALPESVELDLYADLHVRGVTLVLLGQ